MLANKQISAQITIKKVDRVVISTDGSKHIFIYSFIYAIFSGRKVVLRNVPIITDTDFLVDYARFAGTGIKYNKKRKIIIIESKIKKNIISTPFVINCRSSLLALTMHFLEFSYAAMVNSIGGCQIGDRKIDQHNKIWNLIGANVKIGNLIELFSNEAKGKFFSFDTDTTMGTVCALYALSYGRLKKVKKISTRPEILELIKFLNLFSNEIIVDGDTVYKSARKVKLCDKIDYTIPDDIDEALGFAALCFVNKINARINAKIPHSLAMHCLEKISLKAITWHETHIIVRKSHFENQTQNYICISAGAYPDIGSDQQPIFSVLASICAKKVIVSDRKFPNRFRYMDQLSAYGWSCFRKENGEYNIQYDLGKQLDNIIFNALDLRAGFAYLLCGSWLSKHFKIEHFEQVLRGYSNIKNKLSLLGFDINLTINNSHKIVAAIIRNSYGHYVFQRRDRQATKNPGMVSFFGGAVEPGETPHHAIQRELFEELGLHVKAKYKSKHYINENCYSTSGTVYLYEILVENLPQKCFEGEVIVKTADKAIKEPLTPFVRSILEGICQNKEKVNVTDVK